MSIDQRTKQRTPSQVVYNAYMCIIYNIYDDSIDMITKSIIAIANDKIVYAYKLLSSMT